MEAYGHGAALLAGPGDVGSVSRLIVPTGAELDRDRQRSDSSRDVADRPLDEMRILQHGGAGAVAADLLHRAAHVDIDGVDGAVILDGDAGARGEHLGIVSEDLDGERPLRRGPLEIAERLIAAVHEAVAADHLRVRDGGAHLPAEQPERPVRHARERREEIPIR